MIHEAISGESGESSRSVRAEIPLSSKRVRAHPVVYVSVMTPYRDPEMVDRHKAILPLPEIINGEYKMEIEEILDE